MLERIKKWFEMFNKKIWNVVRNYTFFRMISFATNWTQFTAIDMTN